MDKNLKVANRLAFFQTALLALALVVSCARTEEAGSDKKRPPITAHTETVQRTTVPEFLQAPGTVRARTSTVVSARIMGQILSIKVREGDAVSQGQVVAEIEARDASTQLRRAQAAVAEAQHGLEETEDMIRSSEAAVRMAETNRELALSTRTRFDALHEKRSVSPQEYDEVDSRYKAAIEETERAKQALSAAKARRLQSTSRLEQANAAVESARVMVGYSLLTSPITGIVTSRNAEPGIVAMPGVPLLTIEDPASHELEVTLEESRASAIREGQTAKVGIDAFQGKTWEGRIREIAPSSDLATRTYTAKVQLLGDSHALRAGAFGRASLQIGNREALVIPASAVIRRGQLEGVYVVIDGVATFRLVKTGKIFGGGVEILSGLTPGARVVTSLPAGIADGVGIIEDPASGSTP